MLDDNLSKDPSRHNPEYHNLTTGGNDVVLKGREVWSAIRARPWYTPGSMAGGLLAGCLLLIGCGGETASSLDQTEGFPCTLSYEPTGVVITGDSSGLNPDPLPPMTRDSQGNYYTAGGGGILIWSSSGRYLRTLAPLGEGPGELAPGLAYPQVVAGDTLFVRDNRSRFMVYGPDHGFVRSFPQGPITLPATVAGTLRFLENGQILSSSGERGSEAAAFVVLGRDGSIIRRFGETDPEAAGPEGQARSIAPDGADGFWASLPQGSTRGYTLEHWTLKGDLTATLTRRVPWFSVRPKPSRQSLKPGSHQMQSSISSVDQLPGGLLLIRSRVLKSDWVPSDDTLSQLNQQRAYDSYTEVIDPVARKVLASTPTRVVTAATLFPGSLEGYRTSVNDLGGWVLPLIRVRLDGPASAGCVLPELAATQR